MKNILFSTDGISGYKENVEKVLKEKFNIVKYIENYIPIKNERTICFKFLRELAKKNKIAEKYYKKYIEKYYCKLLDKYKEIEFDYFLVVAGQEFSKEFIRELKRRNPKIKCILYLWDKFEYTTLRNSAEEFDYIFSFDPEDCRKYGFYFRPIFYIDDCQKSLKDYEKRKYDIFYIGSLREEERYNIINEIYKYSVEKELSSFLKLITKKRNRNLNQNIVSTEKISYEKNRELLKNSKVTLDLGIKGQSGLTIRASEVIGTKTKLITLNKDIKNYDFYNEKNIFYIKNIEEIKFIPKNFFAEEYIEIKENIRNRYTTKGFIEEIFNIVNGGKNER